MPCENVSGQYLQAPHLWVPSTSGGALQPDLGFVLKSGNGVFVKDTQRRVFIDANSNLWNAAFGYSNQYLLEAAKRALDTLPCASLFRRVHQPAVQLSTELHKRLPEYDKVFFTSSGSEATDTSIRIINAYMQVIGQRDRSTIGYLPGSYHGVTLAGLSLMGIPSYVGSLASALQTIELPDPWEESHTSLNGFFSRYGASISAVFLEFIQGSGGVRAIPAEYLQELWTLAARFGFVIVGDEIATGIFRAGPFTVASELGLWPDILLLGKALSGGYAPLAAVAVREHIFDRLSKDAIGSRVAGFTAGGHPVSCALGVAVLEYIMTDEFQSALTDGATFLAQHMSRCATFASVETIRGRGHMYGILLNKELLGRFESSTELLRYITSAAIKQRVLLHPLALGVIPVFPPLTSTVTELDAMLDRICATLRKI